MTRQHIKDLTVGNETRLLLTFALPMLVGNLFQQFYNMVDSIVVGNYVGKNALAAVGACSSLVFLVFSMVAGFANGAGVLIAQYFGCGDDEKVKHVIGNAIYPLFGMSLLVSIGSLLLSRPILTALGTPEAIFADALLYLRIACGGIVFIGLYNGIAAMLRALGDSSTPLIFLIVACVLNIIGDLVFVLVFHLAVAGVALATILAQLLAAVSCIVYAVKTNPYFRLTAKDFRPHAPIIKKCLQLGIPFGAQGSLIAISCVILQSVINRFGEDVIAAFTATSRIEQLVQQPFSSLGTALATFTGQNLGAGKVDRVKKGFRSSTIAAAIFSALMLALMVLFGNQFVGLFVNDEAVVAIGGSAIRITALFYFPLGMIYLPRSLLNGAGDSTFAFISGLVEVIGRVVFSLILASIPSIGYWAVWYTTGLTWLITCFACMARYAQGKWMRISLVEKPGDPAPGSGRPRLCKTSIYQKSLS
ncbi:MAG: MATE family efflux transporter [Lachnospiraceae bacterium]|nr:MATE family efflux transporter [Lachnospiraceae bacterium]